MRYLILSFTILIFSCNQMPKPPLEGNSQNQFGIVIHGGAGTILRTDMTLEMDTAYRQLLQEAVTTGHAILASGGSSTEAVEKTIHVMENSPLFNAGKGAVLNAEGEIELDASFMDGARLDAGAIAGARLIKNPISAAIAVMNNSPHVMLSSTGADRFAETQGLAMEAPDYFVTERRVKSLQRVQEEESSTQANIQQKSLFYQQQRFGTVGCVALDQAGNLAAGTSTGGMTNKKWNRIGDAPIIGAGTYANNASCGISATGWGEFFIRSVVAHDIAALVEYKGLSIQEAARLVIQEKVAKLGGDGGVVGLDRNGNVAMEMNTEGMYRAHMNAQGEQTIKIYKDE